MKSFLNKRTLISAIEEKYQKENFLRNTKHENIKPGDILKVTYNSLENDKNKIYFYEGIVISISNRKLGKSFILRRNVQGVNLEQIFPAHSPKIISLEKKMNLKKVVLNYIFYAI